MTTAPHTTTTLTKALTQPKPPTHLNNTRATLYTGNAPFDETTGTLTLTPDNDTTPITVATITNNHATITPDFYELAIHD